MSEDKVKQLSREMAAFSRQTVEHVQKPSSRIVGPALTVVLIALAVRKSLERSSAWDCQR